MSVKVKAEIEGIRFYRDQWGIIVCSIDKVLKGDFIGDKNGMIFKGTMPEPVLGATYIIIADYVEDPKWGRQYNIKSIYSDVSFDKNDKSGRQKFLLNLFTPSQVQAMYDVYDDPFSVLDAEDVEKLVQIKGCGIKTADLWIRKFKKNINIARIFVELEDYGLTNNMIKRLMDRYNSPDLIIEKVKTNSYVLVNEVDGIGWKRADEIALAGNIKPDSPMRIGAYIVYYLNLCGENGNSWITPDELLGAILDNLGEEIPDENITMAIRDLGNKLWWNEDKDKIGLSKYYKIEYRVAEELIRIRNAESNIYCNDWRMRIEHLERVQGWDFTEEQMNGIEAVLNNNVTVIHGLAGTGKTSVVSGVLEALNNYSSVMCALSGRAASRMSEITDKTGYTIHRLLGYPKGANEYQGFEFNQDNKLPYNLYILDEISMVDAKIFYYLLRAIPDGAKLICLGDSGQLESIGCGNVAYDMIHSAEIPTIELTKIHRQAAKSAIITQSVAVRNSKQIVPKDWVGTETRGELQDLELHCYSDSSNTFYEVMEIFSKLMAQKDFNIMDCQIIVPIKTRGDACTYKINNTIQELYNPASKNKKEITRLSNNNPFILREGDKVINTVNNYRLQTPIYNGNIGTIKSISYNEELDSRIITIDFIGIGNVDVPEDAWNGIELGYAITVHKYQGSQSKYVIFGLDFSSYALLTRELVYTGITRAQKKCYLICQTGALRYATAQQGVSTKQTHLQDCLYEVAHPKLIF
jgi:exodeoxyribonuclease V alpha subunit